jgi:hypothetical protein
MKKIFIAACAMSVVCVGSICCSKSANVNCNNAQLCIVNKHGKVVHFGWNTGAFQYNDSIMPNGSACTNVGPVKINSTTNETESIWFYSDDGNYEITVNQCSATQILN